jgi:glutaredoxin 3
VKVLKKPESIVLYSRPMCGWCIEAKEWLDEHGWAYTVKDTREGQNREEAISKSGQPLVPVIDVDGQVLGDFDTGQLEEFLKKLGYLG